jgi:hypothetical protein
VARADYSVDDLVSMMTKGELRLPEMQRRYVWPATRVRDLLDSLYRGYPSGAILMWDTDADVALQDMAITQATANVRPRLLLDGQQRLTSLSAVLRGEPVTVKGRKKPIEILFNLEHPNDLQVVTEVEEGSKADVVIDDDETELSDDELQKRLDRLTFVVATSKLKSLPQWVSVSDVFKATSDAQILKAAGLEGFDDPRYEKYSDRLGKLRGIRNYEYRVDILENALSYEEVTEIFVRVNSLGAKLRSSDLALAQITAKWRSSLAIFEEYQAQCAKSGFDLELGIHLKNLVAMTTGQSRFKSVGGLQIGALQAGWIDAKAGMDYAINFLKNNVGIESPALLASPFLMIAVAAYGRNSGYQLTEEEADQLRKWVLVANAKARYSRGSSETFLDQDLQTIRTGGGVPSLFDRLRNQVGRLDVTPEELEGRNARSALFKEMFLAFRDAGAKDWTTQVAIALDHSGSRDALQFHHIFPKGFLKGTPAEREVDEAANLCFIGGRTNRRISDAPPKQYLGDIAARGGEGALQQQCIPHDAALLSVDAYREFLAARRELIAARINDHIGLERDSE